MAGWIDEDYLSRSFTLGKQAVRELIYHIFDTDDEDEAANLVRSVAPGIYKGLSIDSINADPEGGGKWKGYARYANSATGNEYTFETGGGTQKITQSLGTTIYAGPYGEAPDFSGAIGVNGDSVEGVDVTVPAFEFTETHYFDDAIVTDSYKTTLFQLTGKINNATFKNRAAGEVLFLGASGSKRGDEKWGITYRFACSPNAASLSVGGISGIAKRGWDYLWIRYDDFPDMFAFALVKRPVAAYVERVYQEGNFADMNIG
jgi:hypothetical protein